MEERPVETPLFGHLVNPNYQPPPNDDFHQHQPQQQEQQQP